MTDQLAKDDLLQIEMAAQGCVSGTLAEWPWLDRALKNAGHDLPKKTRASELQAICRKLMGRDTTGKLIGYLKAAINASEQKP